MAPPLLRGEHRPGLGPPAGVSDLRRIVADDHHHRVTFVLEEAQDVEEHQVADVQIGGRRVESELDPQLLTAPKPRFKMLRDMDLYRPLAQALQQLRAHRRCLTSRLGVDWAGTEVDLRIGGQRGREETDDRLLDRPDERNYDIRSVVSVADPQLQRI